MPSHACDRCHRRKVRCDKAVPQCSPCKRSDVECRYAASETQLRRRHVQRLERRIRELQASNDALTERLRGEGHVVADSSGLGAESRDVLQAGPTNRDAVTEARSPVRTAGPHTEINGGNKGNDVADEVVQMSLIAGGEHNFVGSTSGLLLANLLKPRPQSTTTLQPRSSLSPDSGWHTGNACSGGQQLARPGVSALPSRSLAEDLLRAYCTHDHLAYPFLSPKSLYRSLDAVYSAAASREAPDAVDAFFVDMTLAIATAQVHKFNWSGVYDAETHCHRAMARLGDVLGRDGIERVQALLLICQYKMGTTSSDTSTSVWHLIGVAARTCLEMGLHRVSTYALSGSRSREGAADDEVRSAAKENMETRKRCFWSLIALDRITSLALGRPVAIQLEDIDVDFPDCEPLSGEEPNTQSGTLSSATYGTPQDRTATSIFVHIVKYRLICGKILNALHRSSKHASAPEDSVRYQEIRDSLEHELREWHAQIANLRLERHDDQAASPETSSSFRCKEWYQLLFHNGMLMLFRPSPVLNDAPRNSAALQRIHDSSREAIRLYADLHRSRKMNYSWVTMQYVFMAGLSYIYALRNHLQESCDGQTRSRLRAAPTITQVVGSTRACSRVLVAVSERWDPARNCADLFDRLSDAVIADIVEAQAVPVGTAGSDTTPLTPTAASTGGPMNQAEPDMEFGLGGGDLGHQSYMAMTVDTAFRDCFGDLQNLGLDAFHNDALAQLSQGWYRGLEGDLNGSI